MARMLFIIPMLLTLLCGCGEENDEATPVAALKLLPWETKRWVSNQSGTMSDIQPINPRLVAKRFRSRFFQPIDAPIEVTAEYQNKIDHIMNAPKPSVGYRKLVRYELLGDADTVDAVLNDAIHRFAAMEDAAVNLLINGYPSEDPLMNAARAHHTPTDPATEHRVLVRVDLSDQTRRSSRMVFVRIATLRLDSDGLYQLGSPNALAPLLPATLRSATEPPAPIEEVSVASFGADTELAFPSAASLSELTQQLDTPVGSLVGEGFHDVQIWQHGTSRFMAAEIGMAAAISILYLDATDPAIEYIEIQSMIVSP